MPLQGSQLQNIGNAMAGLSSGLQGNLPQFIQQQQQSQMQNQLMQERTQEKQQQAAAERQKTMFIDANAALQLAEQGNYEGIVRLGMERLQLLKNYPDANPEDTQRLTTLALGARNGNEEAAELLKSELRSITDVGKALGAIQEPEAEEFTLGPGQSRFRGSEEIASVPDAEPDSFRTLEARAQAAGLTPGTPEYQEFMQGGGQAGGPDQRAQKIAAVQEQLEQMGVPDAASRAVNVVDGNIRYDVTDQGRVLEINELDGSSREIPIGSPQDPPPEENQQNFSLYGMSEQTSGVAPSAKALGAKVSSMFGMEAFPETVTNRQIAEGATQGLVRALSINDQYPVREIERIRQDMAKIGPSLFSGGPEVRAQMKGLNTLLSNTLNQAQRDANNPQMPTDIRAGAARAANDISNFLDVMGYVDTDILESPEVVRQTPIASLEEYVRVTDESELNQLPEEVEQAIFERLSGRE